MHQRDTRTFQASRNAGVATYPAVTQPLYSILFLQPVLRQRLAIPPAQLRSLIKKGKIGSGVFQTNDCRATYAELKAKGVEFMSEPEE